MRPLTSGNRKPRDTPRGWAGAVAVADSQGGAISYEQLRDHLSEAAISRRIARRDLYPRHDGVHALGRPSLTPFGEACAAVLAAGERGALTRWSAAAALGLAAWPPEPQLMVVGGPLALKGVSPYRTRSLDPDEIVVGVGGLRCTSWPRTVTDLAAEASVAELQTVLNALERAGLLDLVALDVAIRRARGRHGLRKLRRALEPYTTIPAAEYLSLLERFSAMLLHQAELPAHEINGRVQVSDGRRIRVDILFRSALLAVEVDGRETHDRSTQFETDRWRDRELQKLGYIVLRFSWRDVMHSPARVLTDIETCLRRRCVA